MIAICILVATALFGFTAIQVLLFQFNQSEMEETEWRNQVKAARQQQFQMQLEMMGATYSNSNAGSDDETEDFGDDGTGTDFDQNDGFDDEEDDLEIVEEDEDGDEAAPAPFQAPTHTNHDVTNASVSVAPLHQQQDEHHPGLAIHPSVHVHHIQHTHQLIRRDSGQSDDNDMNCFHFFALANEHLEHIDALVQRERETQATFERAMKTHDLRLSRSSLNARLQGRGGNRQPSHRVPVAHTQYQVHSSNLVSSTGSTTPFAMPPPTPTTTLITPPAHPPFPTRSYTLDINAPVKFHSLTPLHFAAMNASPDFIATLLKNGANINALDAHSRTPLRLATNSRRNDILHLLLSHPDCTDIPDADGTTALRSAVFRSDVLMTRAYLRARPAAAHEPLAGGSEGAEGDRGSGIYALHVCASFGALEMIDLLVEEMGADVDARDSLGRTPLMYAATKGKWEAVERLVVGKAGAVLETGMSSLTLVEEEGDEVQEGATTPKLSEKKVVRADPNAQDGHGWTALHYAAVATKSEPLKTIEVLVQNGATIDAKEHRYALTPLHMAAKSGHTAIMNLLVSQGADPTNRTTDNRTCLCFAAYGSHLDCIQALLASSPHVIKPVLPRELIVEDMSALESVMRCAVDAPFWILRFAWSMLFGFRPSLDVTTSLYKRQPPSAVLSPLHLAIRAKGQSHEVIDMLLTAGVDVNAGIPIEVGSEWFAACKRLVKMLTLTRFGEGEGERSRGDTKEGKVFAVEDEDDDKILYVNPVCFALAFGNGDVALKILKHPSQICQAGVFQVLTMIGLSVFMMRWDITLRLLFKTPLGLLHLVFFGTLFSIQICRIWTPTVDAELLKDVWSSCGGPQFCSLACKQQLFARECCTFPANHPHSFKRAVELSRECWTGFMGSWTKQ